MNTLTLTRDTVNTILQALGPLPYTPVAHIIWDIKEQVEKQEEPQ